MNPHPRCDACRSRWLGALMLIPTLGACAAEGALANAMIIEGDAEGNLFKMTEDGLPVCTPATTGLVFYLSDTDQLVYCTGAGYQVMGDGVCDGAPAHGDGGAEAGTGHDAHVDGSVADASQDVACILSTDPEGSRKLACEDGTVATLPPPNTALGDGGSET